MLRQEGCHKFKDSLSYTHANTRARFYSLDFHSVNHEAGSDNEAIKQPLSEPLASQQAWGKGLSWILWQLLI